MNADDWGRDRNTTDCILDCVKRKAVSSVSAMVFMEDSERAAAIARERGIDVGLHLNFTHVFSGPGCPIRLTEHQQRIAKQLLRHRFAQSFFYPVLKESFEYVVSSQCEEFQRLYGAAPERLDGHHHMHLCANVLLANLLPCGTIVRRNFSFEAGEKSFANRFYRRAVDSLLSRRYRSTDFFFSLVPFEPPERLERIFSLSDSFVVEVETHPANPKELAFLAEGAIFRAVGARLIASSFFQEFNS